MYIEVLVEIVTQEEAMNTKGWVTLRFFYNNITKMKSGAHISFSFLKSKI